ncbi:hypothetical protein HG536_0D00810 [Torulaspora globosa]|uniref:DUF2415 domain-containing protein n=1 Tax=Torulaspora globosa TaxID=48254 RepID=A0A7G3ZGC3_9SACH|nr:uncharacterized protein HG536_0D00810 [Torulaspora globosa]QLL32559.1 hypothetical protein HG536_0D00810 [Torulaspora globosa]
MSCAEWKLRVIADTVDTFHGWSVRDSWRREDENWSKMVNQDGNHSYSFPKLGQSVYLDDKSKSLEKPVICQDIYWAQDGTSVVTVHDDYGIRQYLVPECGTNEEKRDLIPFTRVFKNQSIVASRAHPRYSLFNGSERFNIILLSQRGVPLQLYPLSLEASSFGSMRSFDVTNPVNGRFQVAHAIDFDCGNNFLAGFDRNRVSVYDINRCDPVWTAQPSKRQCGSSFQRHIVSCFDLQASQSCLDNTTRYFGTYKGELHAIDQRRNNTQLLYRSDSGNGFIQVLKSANGRFLYGIKRNSNIIDVLDVRQTHQKINELELPFKMRTQKFKGNLSATTGLTMGTDRGYVVNWSSDFVEFGGIDRTCSGHSNVQRFSGDLVGWDRDMPYGPSRFNLIQESPAEAGLFMMSYSPDKFSEQAQDAQSGISLACL